MSKDVLNLNIARFESDGKADPTNPGYIVSVPASLMRGYLDDTYGADFPHNPTDRYITDTLLDAFTQFSTDHEMHETLGRDPVAGVPLWLRDVSPIVEGTKSLGRRVGRHLANVANGSEPLDNEITFTTGLFDTSSLVVGALLGIRNPRIEQNEALHNRAHLAMPEGHRLVEDEVQNAQLFFGILEASGLVRVDYLRTIKSLRRVGRQIVAQAQDYTDHLLAIVAKRE